MNHEKKLYFIPIDGELLEVTKEVYYAYYPEIWRVRYYARKHGECRCTKAQLWMCEGVCPGCQFFTPKKTVYLETPIGKEEEELTLGDVLSTPQADMGSNLIQQELNDKLHWELALLSPEERRICILMTHHSEREAARIMGIPRSTFDRRWKKIQAVLMEQLKDYYDQ